MYVRNVFRLLITTVAVLCTTPVSRALTYDDALVYYDFNSTDLGSGVFTDLGSAGINMKIGSGAPTMTTGPATGVEAILMAQGDTLVPNDGVDDSALKITRDTPFTMSTWIKRSGDSNDFTFATKMLANTGGDDAYRGWWFRLRNDGTLDVLWRYQNNTTQRLFLRSAPLIPDGDTDFHHLAVSFNSNYADSEFGFRVYLDGTELPDTLVFATPGDVPEEVNWDLSTTAPFTLNGRNGAADQEGGYLARFAIWTAELSASDLAAQYQDLAGFHPGDANGDGMVNLADLQILGDNWQSTIASWSEADFTGDGNVNLADLQILGDNWGFGVTTDVSFDDALAGAIIPEPVSLFLLLPGAGIVMLRRRVLR